MKKLIALFVCGAMLLFSGCAGAQKTPDSGKLTVITTVFPAYDFARQVFGDSAEVVMLLKPGMESHTYDPSAKDIVKINNCDLFIYNGGESDEWVENILSTVEGVRTFRMMDCVEALEEEHSEGMQTSDHDDEDDHGDHEDEYDEHIWTSPKNAALITSALGSAAAEAFPENAAMYLDNAADYSAKINALDDRFAALLNGESRYFVFADRFPLLYFFRQYGLNYYAAFPGCGSETEPSAQTISFLSEKLSGDTTVKTVFYIELSNHRLADVLAEEKSLPTAEFHSCHNITADDFEAGETYITLMERNYEALAKALQ